MNFNKFNQNDQDPDSENDSLENEYEEQYGEDIGGKGGKVEDQESEYENDPNQNQT